MSIPGEARHGWPASVVPMSKYVIATLPQLLFVAKYTTVFLLASSAILIRQIKKMAGDYSE
jgi:hypothetical protein